MKSMLLTLLCAAPLVVGYQAYEAPAPETVAPVEAVAVEEAAVPAETADQAQAVYLTCMGCADPDCVDPAHYHYCTPGCTVAEHYHDCPVGCADPTHPCYGQCWEEAGVACPREFCPSMGCTVEGCTDPAHYHSCPAGCADPAHYHNCPAGCTASAHCQDCPLGYPNADCPRYTGHHRGGWGHHGRCHY